MNNYSSSITRLQDEPAASCMIRPLSVDYFHNRLLEAQRILHPGLQEPLTSCRAVLTLSRPVSSVLLGDEESVVMEFFGVFWVLETNSIITGFFNTEAEAVGYAQQQIDR